MRTRVASLLLGLICVNAGAGTDWTFPAGDYGNTRFSELDQVTASNVAGLKLAFTFSTGVLRGHEAAPAVAGDTMYVITPWPNYLYALDLRKPDSPLKWKFEPNPRPSSKGIACCDYVNRGVAVAGGRVFFNTLDAQTVAVDAQTGKELWRVQLGDITKGETMTMAPFVVKDKVLVGNSGGEFGVRGWLTALDAATGRQVWRAYSTGPDAEVLIGPDFKPYYAMDQGKDLGVKSWPADAWKRGGGAVWGWISYDPETNYIFYGTSNPSPWNSAQRPGDNKWSSGVFARDVDTGQAKWFYQESPHDEYDYDAVNESLVIDVELGGRTRKVLARAGRTGYFYLLDRVTGQVLDATPFIPVNATLGVDLKTGRLRPNPDKTPEPGKVIRNICPHAGGGKDWQPTAYSPQTKLVYIPHQNLCQDQENVTANYIQGTPWLGANVKMYPGPGGNRGVFQAWDPAAHKTVWEIRENFPVWRLVLHFGAVDYHARVWINDIPVAEHCGGHTPFSADITFALNRDGPQRVTVWAEDDPQDLEKPRGKQDWRLHPHSIWYPRTTGIWQTVWLESVPATYISMLRWTPSVERWEISFSAFTAGVASDDLRISIRLGCGPRILAHDTYGLIGGEVHRRMSLSDPGIDDYRNELLWSPERPTLLEADVALLRGNEVIDRVQSYTALRSIAVQREKILLNGRPYTMRLVLDQGYWPDTFMTAPSERALREDVVLAKSMGFNGVRKHQKLEDPRYLYWADTLGLLVWGEMPSAYRFTTRSINRLMREWTEAMERDISHPCVIMWVPFNESWGVPELSTTPAPRDAVAAFYHLTRTLDPSRLVVGNDGWESSATDVIGIHDYDCDPNHMHLRYGPEVTPKELVEMSHGTAGRLLTLDGFPHRGQPICLTEFGGVAFIPGTPDYRDKNWGYSRASTPEEFERLVCGVIEAARTTAMFSGFCYTQFADTFQEVNGLLFADRTPKIPLEKIAEAVRGPRQR